jgi:5-methylcytosine-specific restriction endonuclease McrA
MDGSRFSLWFMRLRAWKVFSKEKKLTRHQVNNLINRAFPSVPYSENRYAMVKGGYSPFNGDLTYWSKRNSFLYDGATSKALKKQNHICGHCGLSFLDRQRVHLHHIDGNHHNWIPQNLLAVHQSCHDYIHMSKR